MEVYSAYSNCPRCSEAIESKDVVVVCRSCGWMPSTQEIKEHNALQKRMLKIFSVFGFVVIASYVHVVNWDKHAVAIIPLKAKQLMGATDSIDLNRIAEICADRFKHECSETALTELAYNYNEREAFEKLGLLQRKMKKWSSAAKSYEMALSIHEKTNGEDIYGAADIFFGLAKAYENIGNKNLAIDYYQRAIQAKPGVIQVTVTEDLVKLLKSLGDENGAKEVLAEARRRSGSKTIFASLEN